MRLLSVLFLAESSSHEQLEQATIAARLHKIRPVKRTALMLFGTMSAVMVIYYAVNMIHQFK